MSRKLFSGTCTKRPLELPNYIRTAHTCLISRAHETLADVFTHTWSPLFAKHSIDDGKKVEIAAIHPDFGAAMPLSLMEFAGRVLISLTSFQLSV